MAPGAVPLIETVPSLKTMTMAAVRALSEGHPGGFFLMAEGGAVDWAMHGNAAGHMIEEMIDFNQTIEAIVDWVASNGGWEENLILITADHDHLFQGPPTRRAPFPLVIDQGAGSVPGHTWLWSSHSNHLVPVFARGSGAERIAEMADETDPRHGPYIQDTEVFDVLIQAWNIPDPR
jgi:alkaline phosphatase